jgi:hypothetical protein
MATKENKMHTDSQNLSIFPKVTQVNDVAHGPLVFEMGLTAGVTGRQGMLTPRHLIPPPVCRGIHVCSFISLTTNVSRLITVWYLSHFIQNVKVPVPSIQTSWPRLVPTYNVTRNTHVKYQSLSTFHCKYMKKVKVSNRMTGLKNFKMTDRQK